jgi:hypothetical protein
MFTSKEISNGQPCATNLTKFFQGSFKYKHEIDLHKLNKTIPVVGMESEHRGLSFSCKIEAPSID